MNIPKLSLKAQQVSACKMFSIGKYIFVLRVTRVASRDGYSEAGKGCLLQGGRGGGVGKGWGASTPLPQSPARAENFAK